MVWPIRGPCIHGAPWLQPRQGRALICVCFYWTCISSFCPLEACSHFIISPVTISTKALGKKPSLPLIRPLHHSSSMWAVTSILSPCWKGRSSSVSAVKSYSATAHSSPLNSTCSQTQMKTIEYIAHLTLPARIQYTHIKKYTLYSQSQLCDCL